MFYILAMIFGGLLFLYWLETYPFEEKIEMRRLVKEGIRKERERTMHRSSYSQCGYYYEGGARK